MEGKKKFRPNSDLKLMDQVREVLRYYHYAYRTEQTYCDWIKRYLKFHGMKRHPQEMGAAGNVLERLRFSAERCARKSGVAFQFPPHSKFLQLCDTPAGKRYQHPHGPGADGAQGCEDDGDL